MYSKLLQIFKISNQTKTQNQDNLMKNTTMKNSAREKNTALKERKQHFEKQQSNIADFEWKQ